MKEMENKFKAKELKFEEFNNKVKELESKVNKSGVYFERERKGKIKM